MTPEKQNAIPPTSDTALPVVACSDLLAGQRERAWGYIIRVMAGYPDRNDKAVIVQNAMSELGPVPNSMGDAVRKAMAS